MSDEVIRIASDGLESKWGFGDGDMLDDLLEEHGYDWHADDDCHLSNHHEILARVVERLVVPFISLPADAEVYRIGTCHNPIRLREELPLDSDDLPFVTVKVADILAIAEEVERERGRI